MGKCICKENRSCCSEWKKEGKAENRREKANWTQVLVSQQHPLTKPTLYVFSTNIEPTRKRSLGSDLPLIIHWQFFLWREKHFVRAKTNNPNQINKLLKRESWKRKSHKSGRTLRFYFSTFCFSTFSKKEN